MKMMLFSNLHPHFQDRGLPSPDNLAMISRQIRQYLEKDTDLIITTGCFYLNCKSCRFTACSFGKAG